VGCDLRRHVDSGASDTAESLSMARISYRSRLLGALGPTESRSGSSGEFALVHLVRRRPSDPCVEGLSRSDSPFHDQK